MIKIEWTAGAYWVHCSECQHKEPQSATNRQSARKLASQHLDTFHHSEA
jgi:hypothetical protein